MKKIFKTTLLCLILIMILQPCTHCFAFYSISTNQQLINYIEAFKPIQNTLYKNGELAYSIKLSKGDYSKLQNSIIEENSKIDKYRAELESLVTNQNLSNIDRSNSLALLIGIGYYRLANNELINFLNNQKVDKSFANLISYFNFRYTGYSSLDWLESYLKSKQ